MTTRSAAARGATIPTLVGLLFCCTPRAHQEPSPTRSPSNAPMPFAAQARTFTRATLQSAPFRPSPDSYCFFADSPVMRSDADTLTKFLEASERPFKVRTICVRLSGDQAYQVVERAPMPWQDYDNLVRKFQRVYGSPNGACDTVGAVCTWQDGDWVIQVTTDERDSTPWYAGLAVVQTQTQTATIVGDSIRNKVSSGCEGTPGTTPIPETYESRMWGASVESVREFIGDSGGLVRYYLSQATGTDGLNLTSDGVGVDWLFSDAGLYRVSYALHQPCGELYCTLVSRYGLPDETASPDPLQPAGATWSWKGPATTLTFGAYATWCGVSLSGDKVKIVHERRE